MSAGAQAAIIFNIVLTVALPVGIMLWLRRRGGRWSAFFTGAAVFVFFAMVVEQGLHYLVLKGPWADAIQNNIWLYALYGGLAAGLFEETGRLAAFRLLLKKQTSPVTALSYGAGHGGMEAFLVVGLTMLSNLVLAVLADSGNLPDPALAAAAETVMATSAGMFLWAGFERVTAIALHMANSVLVFTAAAQRGKRWLYPAAILTHAGVNLIAVICNHFFSVPATELVVLFCTLLVALAAGRVYQNLREIREDT